MDALKFISENRIVSISRQVYGENLLEAAKAIVDGGIKQIQIA